MRKVVSSVTYSEVAEMGGAGAFRGFLLGAGNAAAGGAAFSPSASVSVSAAGRLLSSVAASCGASASAAAAAGGEWGAGAWADAASAGSEVASSLAGVDEDMLLWLWWLVVWAWFSELERQRVWDGQRVIVGC